MDERQKNIGVIIEYDGTDFAGWQIQPGQRTVQGVLEDALADLIGSRISVNGAGRTDAGVHATGQVANFKLMTGLDTRTVRNALNARLPPDVLIVDAAEKDDDFHARFSATSREYMYRIGTRTSVLNRRFRWEMKYELDSRAMGNACMELMGRNDFTTFTCDDYDQAHCDVKKASIAVVEDEIRVNIEADRFLRKMVRSIVGTLVEIGRGRLQPASIGQMLATQDRAASGPSAPARGLCLLKVKYDYATEGRIGK